MRTSSEQLPQQLKRGLFPLYTVFGDELLLALEAADRIRAKAHDDGYGEREVLTAEQHFDWSRLRMSTQSQSLFSTRRILELRIPNGKPGVEGSKVLQAFSTQLPADTVTLIVLPELDWRAQKASWFAALDAAGTMVEAKQVTRAHLPTWLAGRLREQQQSADGETLDFIADRVEGNLLAAYQEVQKLALLFPSGQLTFDQVKDAVLDVARFDVSDLGSIVVAGDAAHLARMLDGLQGEGVAPPLVLWVIANEIRALGRVIALIGTGQPLAQALRDARVWGGRQNIIEQQARRFTLPQIEAALMHAAQVDRIIKGLAKGDVWIELLELGLRFSCKSAKTA